MITPKEFDQERADFKSQQYEEALKIAENISENMRKWAATEHASNWFIESGTSSIWISEDVESVKPIRSNKILREIVFEQFKKNGWDMWLGNDNKIYFRPHKPEPRKPNFFELVLMLFGYKPNLESG